MDECESGRLIRPALSRCARPYSSLSQRIGLRDLLGAISIDGFSIDVAKEPYEPAIPGTTGQKCLGWSRILNPVGTKFGLFRLSKPAQLQAFC
jgi:hypothetical protein